MESLFKLVFTFDTDQKKAFSFTVSNAKEAPLTDDIKSVAQAVVAGDVLIPSSGEVTGLKKVEHIATTTTAII